MKKNEQKFAIIGMGHLGTLLVQRLCKVFKPQQIVFGYISEERLPKIKEQFPHCTYAGSNFAAINEAKTVFLTVRPLQAKTILSKQERGKLKTKDKVFISLMAAVRIKQLSVIFKSKNIIKCAVAIGIESGAGPIVFKTHDQCDTTNAYDTLSILGSPIIANKEYTVDHAIISSGSLFALVIEHIKSYTDASHNMFSDRETIRCVIAQTFVAAGLHCLDNGNLTEQEIIESIATKGGITATMLEKLRIAETSSIMDSAIVCGLKRMDEVIDLIK